MEGVHGRMVNLTGHVSYFSCYLTEQLKGEFILAVHEYSSLWQRRRTLIVRKQSHEG